MISDQTFCRKWQDLYDSCPWGTVFQSPIFLKTWFAHYESEYDHYFVCQEDENLHLSGLLPLAVNKKTGKLSIAGDNNAEYQTWLARPEDGNTFIENAFEILKKEFPKKKLDLLFLAPNTPLEFISTKCALAKQSELSTHVRPLMEIGDGEKFENSLRKKGNKTRLRQLRKFGEIKLEKLETAEEFAAIFDEIEDYAKLRLSALHHVIAENDPHRQAFHQDLMKIPGLIYASILKVGNKIGSANISIQNRDELLFCITSMSPFFAHQSPSKVHLLMFGSELAANGYPLFDLSPGNGYKERFATRTEPIFSLKIFFNKSEFRAYRTRKHRLQTTRKSLGKIRVTKDKLVNLADIVKHKLRRVKIHTIPRTLLKNVANRVYNAKECRIYSLSVEQIRALPRANLMKVDSINDLLMFNPAESWQHTISSFHKMCLSRIEAGNSPYTFSENGLLLHYGWTGKHQATTTVYEVDQTIRLRPNSVVLFDYYTHPQARRRGLYYKALLQGLHDSANLPDTEYVYIGVLAKNKASRYVIEKVGFIYQGSLFRRVVFNRATKWQNFEIDAEQHIVTS